MLDKIKLELADNYTETSDVMLQSIIGRVTADALSISNNKEINLENEIIECVKTIYLLRGSEDVSNRSQNGISSTYKDAIEKLKNNIINGAKRKMF